MEHIAVSIPNLDMVCALPLFHDFLQRGECSSNVVNRDDAPTATVEVLVGDLAGRVAREEIRLAKGCGKHAKSSRDRFIELANRLVIVALGWSACWRWSLDLQEGLDR